MDIKGARQGCAIVLPKHTGRQSPDPLRKIFNRVIFLLCEFLEDTVDLASVLREPVGKEALECLLQKLFKSISGYLTLAAGEPSLELRTEAGFDLGIPQRRNCCAALPKLAGQPVPHCRSHPFAILDKARGEFLKAVFETGRLLETTCTLRNANRKFLLVGDLCSSVGRAQEEFTGFAGSQELRQRRFECRKPALSKFFAA